MTIGLIPQLQDLAQQFIQKEQAVVKTVDTVSKAITGVNGLKIPGGASLSKLLGSLPTGISTIASTAQSFSSAIQSLDRGNGLGGFLNSAIGTAQTLAGAVTSVVGAAGSLGIDVSALGGLSQKILGVNNFAGSRAQSHSFSLTPKFAYELAKGSSGLTFPLDLDFNERMERIQLSINKYQKTDMVQPASYIREDSIFLPLPRDLRESYNPIWTDYSPGPIRGLVDSAIRGAKDAIENTGPNGFSDPINSTYQGIQNVYNGIVDSINKGSMNGQSPADKAAAISSIGQLGLYYVTGPNSDLSNMAGNFTGRSVNPYTTVAFQGMSLRQHNFIWVLAAKSARESGQIVKIFNKLRDAALPKNNNGFFLEYPKVINVKFLPDEKALYNFKRCVISNLSIDHAGSGTPSFFHETGLPVIYILQLGLKEIELYTNNDIGKASDDTSDTSAFNIATAFNPFDTSSDEDNIISHSVPSGTSVPFDGGLF